MTDTRQLGQYTRAAYTELDDAGVVAISAGEIADTVYRQLDPGSIAPLMVRASCLNDLRRRAESVLRQHAEDEQKRVERGQDDMFTGMLQTRYPCNREGQDVYVPPAHMTSEEGEANVGRLHKEAQSKTEHADALAAYFANRNSLPAAL